MGKRNKTIIANITTLSKVGQGDCLKLLETIEPDSIDLILTDPPYNLGRFMRKRGTNIKGMRNNHFAYSGWDDLAFSDWVKEMTIFLNECHRVLKKRGALVMFMSVIKAETIINIATQAGFYYKTVGIWHKTNPMPRNMNLHFINSTESWIYFINDATTGTFNNNGKPIHDFIETATISISEHKIGKHPTQKPKSILQHFVSTLTNEGDVVLDPFMGSGSTGVVCELTNRHFVGFELDTEYYNIACDRIIKKV